MHTTELGIVVPYRRSLTMQLKNKEDYESVVKHVRRENNRVMVRRCRYNMSQLAANMMETAYGRELTSVERNTVLSNEQ